MSIVEIFGIIGGFCFAYCGVPAAWATWKAGKSIGTPISVASMILVGAITMYIYLLLSYGFNLLLAINYGIEAVSWAVVVYYHFFPRK